MSEQKYYLERKYFSGFRNAALDWWDCATIKKARQDDKQNQATSTIINYIKDFMSI